MPESELMHLAIDISFIQADGKWNVPGGWVGYDHYPSPRIYEDLARIAERGKLDLLFFGDTTGIADSWEGSLDAGVRWGVNWPRHDNATLIPLMAAAAPGVGFGYTVCPTFMHPYHIARLTNSLDHITEGRVALNLVTSTRPADYANYGHDMMMDHDDRYERLEEFAEVCQRLWDSVEPEAIIRDRATGVFADPTKVHPIDHRGKHWDVAGPLNCLPSPQGRLPLIQAGQSPRGIEASARFADYVFAQPTTKEFQISHRARLDALAVSEGRNPRDIGVLWGLPVCVAETEAEARAKFARMHLDQPVEAMAALVSYSNGFDFSLLPPRFTLAEARELQQANEATQMGFIQRLILQEGEDLEMDLAELLHAFQNETLARTKVGTPEQIADAMEEMHEHGGRNGGFMFSGTTGPSPRSQLEIVELLIPELQRRGVFRTEYEGTTVRDHLNQ